MGAGIKEMKFSVILIVFCILVLANACKKEKEKIKCGSKNHCRKKGVRHCKDWGYYRWCREYPECSQQCCKKLCNKEGRNNCDELCRLVKRMSGADLSVLKSRA